MSLTLREKTYNQNRGVCQRCGMDIQKFTIALANIHAALVPILKHDLGAELYELVTEKLRELGFGGLSEHTWEANHITAKADGGSDNLDNMELLCMPCHRDTTRRWAKLRLSNRKRFPGKPLLS
jgi:5-methylcytosine-specific restriction endonuclease McrA